MIFSASVCVSDNNQLTPTQSLVLGRNSTSSEIKFYLFQACSYIIYVFKPNLLMQFDYCEFNAKQQLINKVTQGFFFSKIMDWWLLYITCVGTKIRVNSRNGANLKFVHKKYASIHNSAQLESGTQAFSFSPFALHTRLWMHLVSSERMRSLARLLVSQLTHTQREDLQLVLIAQDWRFRDCLQQGLSWARVNILQSEVKCTYAPLL